MQFFIQYAYIYIYICKMQMCMQLYIYIDTYIYIYIIGVQYRRVASIAGITTKAFDAALSVLFEVESLLKKSLLEGVTTRHAAECG